VAFVSVEFRLSERTACKLLGVERSSYRYEPRPDRNLELREDLAKLARQKPRYGYRRLHALLERRGYEVNVKRVYRLYAEEGLAVRRRKRKRMVRDRALEPRLIRPNQEWAMDFIIDGLATGRMVRILSVVDAYTRECLALEADTSLGSGRVTRVLERLIGERGRPENLRSDNGPEFTSRRMLGWAEDWKVGGTHPAWQADAERACRELPRKAARRVSERQLVPHAQRRKKHPGELAAGVQLRTPAQLARLQDAGGVPAESRLCRCGKQRTLPTCNVEDFKRAVCIKTKQEHCG
jgi:transposase InsO family protein